MIWKSTEQDGYFFGAKHCLLDDEYVLFKSKIPRKSPVGVDFATTVCCHAVDRTALPSRRRNLTKKKERKKSRLQGFIRQTMGDDALVFTVGGVIWRRGAAKPRHGICD